MPFFTPILVLVLVHERFLMRGSLYTPGFLSKLDRGIFPCLSTEWRKGAALSKGHPFAVSSCRVRQGPAVQGTPRDQADTRINPSTGEKQWNQVCLPKGFCLGSPVACSCTSSCLWCWEGVAFLSCLWELPLLHGGDESF